MFSVGLPLIASTLRGQSMSDIIPNARDVIRHQIDNARETPRIINSAVQEVNKNVNKIKALNNRGYDRRNLVKEARNKLRHNKAISSFMDTPFTNEFLGV